LGCCCLREKARFDTAGDIGKIMKSTVFTCDICKKSKDENDLCKIEVKTSGIKIKAPGRWGTIEIDICKDCLMKKGFIVEPKPELDEQQTLGRNKMTLEEKLYEILEDMDVVFRE